MDVSDIEAPAEERGHAKTLHKTTFWAAAGFVTVALQTPGGSGVAHLAGQINAMKNRRGEEDIF